MSRIFDPLAAVYIYLYIYIHINICACHVQESATAMIDLYLYMTSLFILVTILYSTPTRYILLPTSSIALYLFLLQLNSGKFANSDPVPFVLANIQQELNNVILGIETKDASSDSA